MSAPPVVTEADIDLALESMIRRETFWLRNIGWAAEAFGWLAMAGAVIFAVVQWDSIETFTDRGGDPIARWRGFVGFLLPTMMSVAVAGVTAVLLGRGARLFALHQAARRGINLTGLTLTDPIDAPAVIDLEDSPPSGAVPADDLEDA